MNKLYLRTTQDELELPIAVADSPTELARMCGTTANNVSSSIAHGRKGWYAVIDEPEMFPDNEGGCGTGMKKGRQSMLSNDYECEGQINMFSCEKVEPARLEDMTNLEYMRTLSAEELVHFIFEKTDYMCLQRRDDPLSREIWEIHCRTGKYSGDINGCKRCRIDWLKSKVGSREKDLHEQAVKRREEIKSLKNKKSTS